MCPGSKAAGVKDIVEAALESADAGRGRGHVGVADADASGDAMARVAPDGPLAPIEGGAVIVVVFDGVPPPAPSLGRPKNVPFVIILKQADCQGPPWRSTRNSRSYLSQG
jgi:hypothetical protein